MRLEKAKGGGKGISLVEDEGGEGDGEEERIENSARVTLGR